jgi:hypothetical protein
MAWGLAERAAVAKQKLESAKKKDVPFYEGQVTTAQFFYDMLLPAAMGRMDAVKNTTAAVMAMPEAGFASK